MNTYINIASHALWLIILLSFPPLAVSLVIGLIVSLLQALTQVQEQTLTFVPKIVATIATIVFFSTWMCMKLMAFTLEAYKLIPLIGKSQ